MTRDIKYQLERNANKRGGALKTAVRADVITERLRHALATGNWVGGKAGVSQLLDRTNYMSALSHLRRVVSLSRSQPHFEEIYILLIGVKFVQMKRLKDQTVDL